MSSPRTPIHSELNTQFRISLPLIAMNLSWFAKTAITTVFLGRLGELPLAAGSLAFTFANVTGFSVLNGLSAAMDPVCGQAFGAKNFKLLHKTLVMATLILLAASLPIAVIWLYVDHLLLRLGQDENIAAVSRSYLVYLIPDLVVTSFLCPLKAYLGTQEITLPIMFSSAAAAAVHIPVNLLLSHRKGLQGVVMGVWITDSIVAIMLGLYIVVMERRKEGKWIQGGWWEHSLTEWLRLIKLSGPCCLTTCLEWWCYEILVLLTGRLPHAARNVGVLAIILNFDYLLFAVMLSLSTCVSIRVSNELGASHPITAKRSAYVTLCMGVVSGFAGGSVMVATRGVWGSLYSRDAGIVRGVKAAMRVMALVEVVNFPLAVCGGIVRGTARPGLGTYANVCGFYVVALPLGVVLGLRLGMGLEGLLMGFLAGVIVCFVILLVFVRRIDWEDEAKKAQMVSSSSTTTITNCCVDEDSQECKSHHPHSTIAL